MAKKLENKERSVRVNISIKPSTLERIDKNVERIAKWLIKKGADVRDVAQSVNRSALITEMVESLGTEAGYHSMLTGFSMALGVHGAEQCELFPEDEDKG